MMDQPAKTPDRNASETVDPVTSGTIPTHRIIEAPFLKGEKIAGRYVVQRVLADAGVGVVLAARHLELDETVAVKCLKGEFARQKDIVDRFAREAMATARIESEHVAKVLDVGAVPDRGPYIVMEYLEGEGLESVLATEGKLPVERSVELTLQACEALAAAHARGIIHRDIKPENLFLTRRGKDLPLLKVLDFGVSTTTLAGNDPAGAISAAKTGSLLGSARYMSPEQLDGKTEVDFRTDIWSIGAILYELLTGSVPFEGASITEVRASVLETTPAPISSLAPDVPSGLADVVTRCLTKEPEGRYPSIAELSVALAAFGPKRARACVERAVAVSRSAGLVSEGFQGPVTVPPPATPSKAPGAARASSPPEPVDATAPGADVEQAPSRPAAGAAARRAAAAAAMFALVAGGMFAAMPYLSRPPPATTAATPSPVAPVAPSATAEKKAAEAPSATVATAASAPVEAPPASAARPAARKPSTAASPASGAAARAGASAAPTVSAPSRPSSTVMAPAGQPSAPTKPATKPVRRAIDERE